MLLRPAAHAAQPISATQGEMPTAVALRAILPHDLWASGACAGDCTHSFLGDLLLKPGGTGVASVLPLGIGLIVDLLPESCCWALGKVSLGSGAARHPHPLPVRLVLAGFSLLCAVRTAALFGRTTIGLVVARSTWLRLRLRTIWLEMNLSVICYTSRNWRPPNTRFSN